MTPEQKRKFIKRLGKPADEGQKLTDVEILKSDTEVQKVFRPYIEKAQKELDKITDKIEQYDSEWQPKLDDAEKADGKDSKKYIALVAAYMAGRALLLPNKQTIYRIGKIITQGNVAALAVSQSVYNTVYGISASWMWVNLPGIRAGTKDIYDRIEFANVFKQFNRLYPPTKFDPLNPAKDAIWNGNRIRDTLVSGLNQGKSVQKIARDLKDLPEAARANAMMRARTAAGAAENRGRLDAARYAQEKLGIHYKKRWDNSHDSIVRPSHQNGIGVGGEERELDDPFSNGLMNPCDPSGGWAEIANCRCALQNIEVKK